MNDKTMMAKYMGYSVLAGVMGSVLLLGFLMVLMPFGTVIKFVPWVIGFNSALTGYTLMDRTRTSLNRKRLAAVIAGFLNALITCIAVSAALFYLTEGGLFSLLYLLFLIFIGCLLSWLGAVLAIKYLNLA